MSTHKLYLGGFSLFLWRQSFTRRPRIDLKQVLKVKFPEYFKKRRFGAFWVDLASWTDFGLESCSEGLITFAIVIRELL